MCEIWRRRLYLLSLATIVSLVISYSAPLAATDPKSDPDIEKMLVESVYSKFKGTTGLLVGCELEGTAEKLGIDKQKVRDRMKLRLANTIANVPIFKDGAKDIEPALLVNPGIVSIQIWTVGDDYPVAYHIEITAGLFRGEWDLFRTAVLGYGNSRNVLDTVNDAVDDLIDDFAVAFHKGVGDF